MITTSSVISLSGFKRRKAGQRGFREWKRLFESFHRFDENTRWSDLPDWLLLFLCEGSPESRLTLYDLLMGALGLGSGYEFETLPADTLTPLLDAYFVLMDQVHFECMRRLGWIEAIPWESKPIISQAMDSVGTSPFTLKTPEMTSRHPASSRARGRDDHDYGRWLRGSIPDAVKIFRKSIIGKMGKGVWAQAQSTNGED